MRKTKRILAVILALVLAFGLSVGVFADYPAETRTELAEDYTGKVVILHSNDVHGEIENYACIAQLKHDFEAKGAEVILADAGDFSQGSPYVSISKGANAIEMMNAAGYDVVTLGNHEFDYGYDQLMTNLADAEFETVCADVLKDGEPILPAYTILEKAGVKIGFFGLETPETLTKVNPGLIQGLEFLSNTGEEASLIACAKATSAQVRDAGADLVIGLWHLGVADESAPDGHRSLDVYNYNAEAIDFVIDGHSHTVMTEGENGEPIQSTGKFLPNIGVVVIDAATKTIEEHYLMPTEGMAQDEAVAAKAQGLKGAVDAQYGAVFATSEVELEGNAAPGNRTMETNNGDLITDAMRWSVLKEGSLEVPDANVVAITNGGGIRAAIHVGDVTMKDVNTVLPFGNTVAVVYVTGAELLEALEASTFCTPSKIGGYPQTAGIRWNLDLLQEYDANAETYPGSTYYGPASIKRVTIDSVNGEAFDPEATYAVVTNNFCAAGGDTYYVFKNASAQFDTGIPMDEAVMEYITKELNGVISAEKYGEPRGDQTREKRSGVLWGKTVILHSNDVHGKLEGYAYMAFVRDAYADMGAEVILADAGDFSQGNTYVSTSKGATAIEMMNAVGYDVATLGNHEFDYGYEQLMTNLSEADFTAICADVLKDGESILPGHIIIEKGGVKIGFFGLETPETQTKVNPGLIQGITFLSNSNETAALNDCCNQQIEALKAEGADFIIGLWHLGVDDESAPDGHRSIDVYANAIDGIDLILDGHSHTVMTEGPNGEPVQSTGTEFNNIGVVILDNENKTLVDHFLVSTEDMPQDEAVLAKAHEIMDAVDAQYGAVFAMSEVELNGDKAPGNRTEETNLGDLITDALLWSVLKEGSLEVPDENVVAITNGGGIRAWIHAGDVTMNDIHTVLPFGNTVSVVYVTGAELLEALEASTYCTPTAVGGYPQTAGIVWNLDVTKDYDPNPETYPGSTYYGPASINRVIIDAVNGFGLELDATYAVVTNNFCAAGGDTYYAFANASAQFDTGIPMDEAVMEYITEELGGVITAERYGEPRGDQTRREAGPDMYAGKTFILHSNDVHGNLEGYAAIAQLKKALEAGGATVILADAGDFSQGTPYVSISKGATAIEMMNMVGYDVATLGNHEFDYGYEQLMTNLSEADFSTICADVLKDGETILPAYFIYQAGDVKIGFFGLETPETQTKVNPGLIQGLEFLSNSGEENNALNQCAIDTANALHEAGCDIVVGLWHLGVDDESAPDGHRSVDVYDAAKDAGIDIVLDGHSHTVMTEGPDGEPIQSTGTKFDNVGVVMIDNETKTIENHFLWAYDSLVLNRPVYDKAHEIMDAVDEQYGAVFATSEVELCGDKAPGNRTEETNLGDLITDALRWSVLKEGSLEVPDENVVAITNGGGIRAWIHAGDVTMKDVNTVLPFGNTVAVVYVTGAELLEALEASTYCTPTAVGGYPQTVGIKWNLDVSKEYKPNAETYPGSTYYGPASIERVEIDSVNGQAFDPEATYAVITNNFCAAGGDTYYVFKNASAQFDTGIPMDEAVMEYIETELNGVISAEKYENPRGDQTREERNNEPVVPYIPPTPVTPTEPEPTPEKPEFTDVPEDHWAAEAIDYVAEQGLMVGVTETEFAPEDNMTRAMIATVLYRIEGQPAVETTSTFTDVAVGAWYTDAVNWAAEHEIIKGYSETVFAPDDNVTREMLVTILWRYAKYKGVDVSVGEDTNILSYDDAFDVSSWANAAMCWAVGAGVVQGVTETTLAPQGFATRAQVAMMLMRGSKI